MYFTERMHCHRPEQLQPPPRPTKGAFLSPPRPTQLKPLLNAGRALEKAQLHTQESNLEAWLRLPSSRRQLLPVMGTALGNATTLLPHPAAPPLQRRNSFPGSNAPKHLSLTASTPPFASSKKLFGELATNQLAMRRQVPEKLVTEYTPVGVANIPTMFEMPKAKVERSEALYGALHHEILFLESTKRQGVQNDELFSWRLLRQQHQQILISLRITICECEEQAMRRGIEGLHQEKWAALQGRHHAGTSAARKVALLRQAKWRRQCQLLEENEQQARSQVISQLQASYIQGLLELLAARVPMQRLVMEQEESYAFHSIAEHRQVLETSPFFIKHSLEWWWMRKNEKLMALQREETRLRAAVVAELSASHTMLRFLQLQEVGCRFRITSEAEEMFAAIHRNQRKAKMDLLVDEQQNAFDHLREEEERDFLALHHSVNQVNTQRAEHLFDNCLSSEMTGRAAVDNECWLEIMSFALRYVEEEEGHYRKAEVRSHSVELCSVVRDHLVMKEDLVRQDIALLQGMEYQSLNAAALDAAAAQLVQSPSVVDLSGTVVVNATMALQVQEYEGRTMLDALEMEARVHLYIYEASERYGDCDEEEEAVLSRVAGWPHPTPGIARHSPSGSVEAEEARGRQRLCEAQHSDWLAIVLLMRNKS